jgi:dihydroorotate dehydrogenase (NAD+) catalytic subunit
MGSLRYNLATKIGKLSLRSPLIAASGTFGYAQGLAGLVELKYMGAIITKTITLKERPGNPAPRLVETACGLLNAIGLDNPGLDAFMKEKWPYLSQLEIPVIVSIGADNPGEFVQLARCLDEAPELKAIEVNISCPNIKSQVIPRLRSGLPSVASHKSSLDFASLASLGTARDSLRLQVTSRKHATCDMRPLIAQDAQATAKVVAAVRQATKKTLIVKLTPNVTDIAPIAVAAVRAGADALSLVNTYYGMSVDIKTKRPHLANVTGGLSGPAIKPLSLYAVHKIYRAVRVPIIAGGGIMQAEDAIEFLLCGATALSLGTVNFINTRANKEIAEGIEKYLSEHKITRIRNLTGGLKG